MYTKYITAVLTVHHFQSSVAVVIRCLIFSKNQLSNRLFARLIDWLIDWLIFVVVFFFQLATIPDKIFKWTLLGIAACNCLISLFIEVSGKSSTEFGCFFDKPDQFVLWTATVILVPRHPYPPWTKKGLLAKPKSSQFQKVCIFLAKHYFKLLSSIGSAYFTLTL